MFPRMTLITGVFLALTSTLCADDDAIARGKKALETRAFRRRPGRSAPMTTPGSTGNPSSTRPPPNTTKPSANTMACTLPLRQRPIPDGPAPRRPAGAPGADHRLHDLPRRLDHGQKLCGPGHSALDIQAFFEDLNSGAGGGRKLPHTFPTFAAPPRPAPWPSSCTPSAIPI